jgi:tryptophan 2,3-dioxygenase
MNYTDYLQLNSLLSLQKLESERVGKPAHDELLFIIIHQAYELWFKQILAEIDRVEEVFASDQMDERDLLTTLAALERIVTIMKVLIHQVDILETMTPMDFLEFRSLLYPASGFQSAQFRLVETRLGLEREDRLKFKAEDFDHELKDKDRKAVRDVEAGPSLRDRLDHWLSRMPFLSMGTYKFKEAYGTALNNMLADDIEHISKNDDLTPEEREKQLDGMKHARNLLDAILSKDAYDAHYKQEDWRLSHKGLQAALFINLYRDEPILQVPFKVLSALMDIDEAMATWRYRHALMVYRMIGRKLGTGGTSGHDYLRQTAERHRVFRDLFAIATFLIPRSHRPALPKEMASKMHYAYRE